MIPDKPYSTSAVVGITAVIAVLSWIGTLVAGFNLYGRISLGNIVIVISAAWLLITVGSAYYIRSNTTDYIAESNIWKLWFWLSIVGIVINILAGAVVELGFVQSQLDVIKTLPMKYGVILPWLAIYTIGNLATAFYKWDDKEAISTLERVIYALTGVASLIGTALLATDPSLHGPMIQALVVLSLAQIVTLIFRN